MVYHPDAWYGEDWNPLSYGRTFDFTRPFFEQFAELQRSVPRLGIDIVNCQNSYYCNYCGDDKNCYLDIAGEGNEDCFFNLFTKFSKDCCDCTFAYHSALCYQSIQTYNAYNSNYSMYCEDTSDSQFCFDMKGCKNCLFSSNQRQKEHCIFNEQFSKSEYAKKLAELDLGSFVRREQFLQKWNEFRTGNAIHRDQYLLNCENSSGDNLKNCKNTFFSFNASNCEDSKYLYDVLDAKDCQDLNYSLYKPEVSYELISTLQMTYSAFSMASHYCSSVLYCEMCNNSENLFGCIGLRHKKFCILNKQYTQEEYEKMRSRIMEHMKRTGEWGEFFQASISPWGYNETVAQEYFPLTKEEALQKGFTWYENPHERADSPQIYQIPDHIRDVKDAIVEETLACISCGKNYKIIAQELAYYKRKEIPIPRKCPLCRHLSRNALRAPRKLFERNCTQCGAATKSSIDAKRPEKVFCEKCYMGALY